MQANYGLRSIDTGNDLNTIQTNMNQEDLFINEYNKMESGEVNIFGKTDMNLSLTLVPDEHRNLLDVGKSDDSFKQQQPLPMIRTTPILDVSLPSIEQNIPKLPPIVSKNINKHPDPEAEPKHIHNDCSTKIAVDG